MLPLNEYWRLSPPVPNPAATEARAPTRSICPCIASRLIAAKRRAVCGTAEPARAVFGVIPIRIGVTATIAVIVIGIIAIGAGMIDAGVIETGTAVVIALVIHTGMVITGMVIRIVIPVAWMRIPVRMIVVVPVIIVVMIVVIPIRIVPVVAMINVIVRDVHVVIIGDVAAAPVATPMA